jgi:hypothetical protein
MYWGMGVRRHGRLAADGRGKQCPNYSITEAMRVVSEALDNHLGRYRDLAIGLTASAIGRGQEVANIIVGEQKRLVASRVVVPATLDDKPFLVLPQPHITESPFIDQRADGAEDILVIG